MRWGSAEYEDYWGAAEMSRAASGTLTGMVPLERKQRESFEGLTNAES